MAFTFILLTFVAMTIAVGTSESATIRVGLYNSIPDLNEDDLLSYKEMVEIEFNKFTQGVYTVDAVVNSTEYSPYGDLATYLTKGNFDALEIDTVSLGMSHEYIIHITLLIIICSYDVL